MSGSERPLATDLKTEKKNNEICLSTQNIERFEI